MKPTNPQTITLLNTTALIALILAISGCASQPPPRPDGPGILPYKKVAVIIEPVQYYSFSGGDTKDGIMTTMENALQAALLNKGYVVADRSSMEHVMTELGFPLTGLTHEQLARVGQAIGCEALFIIALPHNEKKVSNTPIPIPPYIITHTSYSIEVSGKLVDVEKISDAWVSDAKYDHGASSMTEAVRRCMESFAQKIPPSQPSQ